jgi:DNA-3-methyladenine glycosylase II
VSSRAPVVPAPLTQRALGRAVEHLASRDADLASIVARHGPPPLWAREPGFPTLIHIILEQQVSLASARAAFDRLRSAGGPSTTPAGFLALDDAELLAIGFSRQKARYGRGLARAILDGDLDLDAIARLDDESAHAALIAVTGIGPWTATIYQLMVLRRPDVWPVGDMALARAIQEVKVLPHRPDPDQMRELGEAWRPWRSVAARLFWHDYLRRRGRS